MFRKSQTPNVSPDVSQTPNTVRKGLAAAALSIGALASGGCGNINDCPNPGDIVPVDKVSDLLVSTGLDTEKVNKTTVRILGNSLVGCDIPGDAGGVRLEVVLEVGGDRPVKNLKRFTAGEKQN